MPNNARHAGVKTAGLLAAVALGAGLLTAAAAAPVAGLVAVGTRDLAKTFDSLPVPKLGFLPAPSRILDQDGNVIASYYPSGYIQDIYRNPVNYDQISPFMRRAIVAIEDSRFWKHGAIDLRGTIRAFIEDLASGQSQGGSDLEQQYVKNALQDTAQTEKQYLQAQAQDPARKIRELRMASIVAHQLTKRQLLAAYLNAAPYDNGAYGVQIAAKVYFSTTAAKLTLPQAALLAGIVNDPPQYDPFSEKAAAIARRNVVLTDMFQQHLISRAAEQAAKVAPLDLHPSSVPTNGCTGAREAPFFCSYVLAVMKHDPQFKQALYELDHIGGLTIRTTLNPKDQRAAEEAVNYIVPARSGFNPGRNADTEVLIQPGTGQVRAIAVDRPYGTRPGQTEVDYAVNTEYGGQGGVQTGSSSKIFTLVTALKEHMPIGSTLKVASPTTVSGYRSCNGGYIPPYTLSNAEGPSKGAYTYNLYNGTALSVNVFFATLEEHVGLCNVVTTAKDLGMTWADGASLYDHGPRAADGRFLAPADDTPSFTLGSVLVSPMSMAAAYATLAANGTYCHPIAITSITDQGGKQLPVESARCHRAISRQVAEAANYIFQAVLTFPGATADNRSIGRPAAAKTGTADNGYYAAFAGWTPSLTGYVSVFNPVDPTGLGAMIPPNDCYREVAGYEECPNGQMFGDDAPGATWEMTFLHAPLGPPVPFIGLPADSPLLSLGGGDMPAVGPPTTKKTKPGHPSPGPPTPPPGQH